MKPWKMTVTVSVMNGINNGTRAVSTYPCLERQDSDKRIHDFGHVLRRDLSDHGRVGVLIHARLPLVAGSVQRRRPVAPRARILLEVLGAQRHLVCDGCPRLLARMRQIGPYLHEYRKYPKENGAEEDDVDAQLQPLGQDRRGTGVVADSRQEVVEPTPSSSLSAGFLFAPGP